MLMDPRISDMAVNIYTNYHALVSVLNCLYCKDSALRRIMRVIAELCMAPNLIAARHVSGVHNVGPDLLSRGMTDKFLEKCSKIGTTWHIKTILSS